MTTLTLTQVLSWLPCGGAAEVASCAAGTAAATLREAIDLAPSRGRRGWLLARARPDLGAELVARLGHAPSSDPPTLGYQVQWLADHGDGAAFDALLMEILDEGGE